MQALIGLVFLFKVSFYTLFEYSPVRVSITIVSPCSTNKGTYTVAPVSTTAGFVALVAVFPLKPGSDSVICNSTVIGGSMANTSPLHEQIFTVSFPLQISKNLQLFLNRWQSGHMFLHP